MSEVGGDKQGQVGWPGRKRVPTSHCSTFTLLHTLQPVTSGASSMCGCVLPSLCVVVWSVFNEVSSQAVDSIDLSQQSPGECLSWRVCHCISNLVFFSWNDYDMSWLIFVFWLWLLFIIFPLCLGYSDCGIWENNNKEYPFISDQTFHVEVSFLGVILQMHVSSHDERLYGLYEVLCPHATVIWLFHYNLIFTEI